MQATQPGTQPETQPGTQPETQPGTLPGTQPGAAGTEKITLLSENPTVSKLTRMVDERKRATEMERKSLRNNKRTEKSDECCLCTMS